MDKTLIAKFVKFTCPFRSVGCCLTTNCLFFKEYSNSTGICKLLEALDKYLKEELDGYDEEDNEKKEKEEKDGSKASE